MFQKLLSLNLWWPLSLAVMLVIILTQALEIDSLGSARASLSEKVAALEADRARLQASALAVTAAAQAQGAVCRLELQRRDSIDQLPPVICPAPIKEVNLDPQANRRNIEFINTGLFAPFDRRLRPSP